MASTADHERLVALAAHDASHDARLLCSDGTSFTTHSCFLGLASPVLQQNLWGPWMRPAEDGYRAISLPQPQAVVRLFVEHAYHGNAAPLPPEHATALLDLAKVYDVPPLTRRCERVLVEHMCVPNAVDALLWADAFLLDDLRTAARKVLLSKFEEVMHEPAFGRLPEADLLTLLSDDGLCIDREETAFEAISIWTSAHESGDFSAPPVDLTALLCTLRFAAMPPGYLREISTHAILQRASMGSAIGDALRELTEELEAADKANDALSVPQPKRQRISPRRHASSASSSSSSPAVTAAAADVGVSATTTAVDDVELSWACAECTFKHSPEQASFAVCRMCGTQRLKASTVTRDEAELACVLSEQSDLYRQMGAHASGPPRTPTPMVAFPPKYALALGGQFATPVGPRPAVRLARAAAAGRVFKFEPEEMEAPGLLAWLGTKGGTLAWANPHTLEQVRISAFFHRFGFHDGEGLVECTDAHAMVDRFGLDVYTVPEASERLSALRQQYTVRRNQERLGSEPEIVRSCFMSNSDEMLLDLKRPFILTSFSASTYSPGGWRTHTPTRCLRPTSPWLRPSPPGRLWS